LAFGARLKTCFKKDRCEKPKEWGEIMTALSELTSVNEDAKAAFNTLKSLERASLAAQSMSRPHIERLAIVSVRAGELFATLSARGSTFDLLGPIIGDEYGFDWSSKEADYVSLKEALIPSLITAIKIHEKSVIDMTFDTGTGQMTQVAITGAAHAAISSAIVAISSAMEV
jgi:hypothetical protein